MNKVISALFTAWNWFSSWGAFPYLILLLLIVAFTVGSSGQYHDEVWKNRIVDLLTWDQNHDELRKSLVVELIGAFIILVAVDIVKNRWEKKLERDEQLKIKEAEEKEAKRLKASEERRAKKLKKFRQGEANYRLKIANELIFPYASKYRDYTRSITTDLFDNSIMYPEKFEFTNLVHLFDRIYFPDTPLHQRAYHQYFASLFRLLDEVNRSIFHLMPAYHADIIELFKTFSQRNEEAFRLYNFFQSVENEAEGIKHFISEMEKVYKANKGSDAEYLKTLPVPLKPYVQLYNLTIANNQFLLDQEERIHKILKQYKDRKTGNLRIPLG